MDALARVTGEVRDCRRCPLWKTRKQGVPGSGDEKAEVVFIGEAPGRQEDLMGRPFVGAAGKILSAALAGAGLSREQVWITNVVKSRPPKNRPPKAEEAAACRNYLERELQIINPKLIVLLGRQALAEVRKDIVLGERHGEYFKEGAYWYLISYHPAATIYNRELRPTFNQEIASIPGWLKNKT